MNKRKYERKSVYIAGIIFRECNKCEKLLELSQNYYRDSHRGTNGYGYTCKRCTRVEQKGVAQASRYGITKEQYIELLLRQDNRCAICRLPEISSRNNERKHLSLDHDHESITLREFLCQRCNDGLGRFQDDPILLRQAADYLERFNSLNQKNRVGSILVYYSDGTSEKFENINALYSRSTNWKKDLNGKIAEEWIEHNIVWTQNPLLYEHIIIPESPKELEKTPEEIEAESLARVEEKKKNPLYAGTQDERDFYIGGVSHAQWDDVEAIGRKELPAIFKKQSLFPEFDLKDLMEGYGNSNGHDL